MDPVGGVFRELFIALHANSQRELCAFVRTDLYYVGKSNDFPAGAIKAGSLIPQRFQLGLYARYIFNHLKNQATEVGVTGMVMHSLSLSKSIKSSGWYCSFSPCKT